MLWIGIIAFLLVGLTVIAIFVSSPMKIPREADREGVEDAAALQAYYRASRWPVFTFERYLILKALNQIKPIGQIIDVGCGPGFLTAQISRELPEVKVIGLDINEATLKNAKRTWLPDVHPKLEFLIGDAQQLPFLDNSVDFVISSLSLHHWADAHAVFQEISRILKPGGKFLIFDLRRDSPTYFYYALKIGQAALAPKAIRKINGAVGSFWAAYTPSEIMKTIQKIPLENLRIESRVGWMFISARKPGNL
jgi:ubiquinone/menaquinone biosynthesis C-methylase UbiE